MSPKAKQNSSDTFSGVWYVFSFLKPGTLTKHSKMVNSQKKKNNKIKNNYVITYNTISYTVLEAVLKLVFIYE